MFNLNKDRFLSTETEKNKLEKDIVELRNEWDKFLRENNDVKDQLWVFSSNALRDTEII